MGNEIATPLQSIIAQAAQTPAETGATERFRLRHAAAGEARLLLADVSASMAETVHGQRKCDLVEAALHQVLKPGVQIIAFASTAEFVAGGGVTFAGLPHPMGGTALHKALDLASLERPCHTLVISDGCPDSREKAITAAERMSGTIDVLYIGPEDNVEAMAFMRALARTGGGRMERHDLGKTTALAAPIRRLLLGVKGIEP